MNSSRYLLMNAKFKMTPEEQELFLSLNFKINKKVKDNNNKDKLIEVIPPTLKLLCDQQQQLAARLVYEYKHGSKNRQVDLDKAAQYEKIAYPDQEDENRIHPNQYLTTDNLHWLVGWFTSIRLFLTRANKISVNAGGRAFLPSLFAIGGLSYALTFSVDVIEVLLRTFWLSKTESELNLEWGDIFWRRFKNVFLKDKKRLSRMANDGLWFGINLAAFILTGGIVAIINIAGFAFDLAHEAVISLFEYRKHEKFFNKISRELRLERIYLRREKEKLGLPNYDQETLMKYIKEREEKIQQLVSVKMALDEKKRDAMATRLRIVSGTAIAFIGTLLVLFPPTSLPGALLIGGGLALVGGSVMVGLGKRIYDLGMKYIPLAYEFTQKAVKNPASLLKLFNKPSIPIVAPLPAPVGSLLLYDSSNLLPHATDEVLVKLEDSEEKSEGENKILSPKGSYRDHFKPILPKNPSKPILIPARNSPVQEPDQNQFVQSAPAKSFDFYSQDYSTLYFKYGSLPDQIDPNPYGENFTPSSSSEIEVY